MSRFNLSTSGPIGLFEALRVTQRESTVPIPRTRCTIAFARKATTDGTLLVCFRFLPGSAPSHPPTLPPCLPACLPAPRLTLSLFSFYFSPPGRAVRQKSQEGSETHSSVCVHAETVSDFVSRFLRAVRERSRSQ